MFKKKVLAALLAMLLVVGLFGCENAYEKEEKPSSSTAPEPPPASALQDGSYTARYSDPAFDGSRDMLTILVHNGEVSIQEYQLIPGEQQETRETSSAAASSQAEPTPPDLEKITDAVLAEYERAESLEKMQPVVGALEHGWRFLRMMQMLLTEAESGGQSELLLERYSDGEYICTSAQADRNGLRHTLSITVSGGQIETALLKADGDYDSAVYDALAEEFAAQNGDTEKMQVQDAHYSVYKSLLRLAPSLMKGMITGEQVEVKSAGWIDGQYRAQFSDFDENGWKSFVDVTITGGTPIVTRFDAFHEEDETLLRSQDADVEERMKEANGINFAQAAGHMLRLWRKAQNDVSAVDCVAGATVASNDFKVLLGELLSTAALEGNTAPIEVARFVSEPAPK